jgi:hypothetical protein
MRVLTSGQIASNHDPILGEGPVIFWDTVAPRGNAAPWSFAPVGSIYIQKGASNYPQLYVKASDNRRDDDWLSQGFQVLSERVTREQFTDGGGASGTYTMTKTIPAGAWVLRSKLLNVVGFTGNTSAVVTIGDGSDVDRYNTGTPSVFSNAVAIDLGAPSGTQIHTSPVAPVITVTGGSDFTNITAGAMTVEILYWL